MADGDFDYQDERYAISLDRRENGFVIGVVILDPELQVKLFGGEKQELSTGPDFTFTVADREIIKATTPVSTEIPVDPRIEGEWPNTPDPNDQWDGSLHISGAFKRIALPDRLSGNTNWWVPRTIDNFPYTGSIDTLDRLSGPQPLGELILDEEIRNKYNGAAFTTSDGYKIQVTLEPWTGNEDGPQQLLIVVETPNKDRFVNSFIMDTLGNDGGENKLGDRTSYTVCGMSESYQNNGNKAALDSGDTTIRLLRTTYGT